MKLPSIVKDNKTSTLERVAISASSTKPSFANDAWLLHFESKTETFVKQKKTKIKAKLQYDSTTVRLISFKRINKNMTKTDHEDNGETNKVKDNNKRLFWIDQPKKKEKRQKLQTKRKSLIKN